MPSLPGGVQFRLDEKRPELVYRAFSDSANQIAKAEVGHRLSSAWFKSKKRGVSIYLGSETTLLEVCSKHQGQGVACLLLEEIEKAKLKIENDPEAEQGDLAGHRIIYQGDKHIADNMASAAVIVIALPGYQVTGAGGSVGETSPFPTKPQPKEED